VRERRRKALLLPLLFVSFPSNQITLHGFLIVLSKHSSQNAFASPGRKLFDDDEGSFLVKACDE
jgi:hypothetical protein